MRRVPTSHTSICRIGLATFVLLPMSASPASANIGLPMVAIFLPPMWLGLLPIILIEAVVVAHLTQVPFGRSVFGTSVANVASTLIGVPVLWCLWATSQMLLSEVASPSAWSKLYAVTLRAAWLGPVEAERPWMVAASICSLVTVFLLLSILVEAPIVRRLAGISTRPWRSVALANFISYFALGLFLAALIRFPSTFVTLAEVFGSTIEFLMSIVFWLVTYVHGT